MFSFIDRVLRRSKSDKGKVFNDIDQYFLETMPVEDVKVPSLIAELKSGPCRGTRIVPIGQPILFVQYKAKKKASGVPVGDKGEAVAVYRLEGEDASTYEWVGNLVRDDLTVLESRLVNRKGSGKE
jgi:hypothetical protein